MENLSIPTLKDWGEIQENELDLKCAFKRFFGKTFSEAEKLFAENAIHFCDHLYFLPDKVFAFYGRAFAHFLLSDNAEGNSDGASGFLSVLEFRSMEKPDGLLPIWQEWQPTLEKLANQQDF